MKSSKAAKPKRTHAVAVAVAAPPEPQRWPYALGLFLALLAVLEVYWPSMYGPFLLDDSYLPYMHPNYVDVPLIAWVKGMRPLLMFSYWLNYQHAGATDTFAYHMVNVFLHFFNGILILLAVRKVLSWAGTDKWLSGVLAIFAAGLFLLHPLQTESVSYIASRSETLSVFFVLAAFVVFLYRETGVLSLARVLAVLALFGAAVLTKEHTAVLPALLLLTDYYWNPAFSVSGIRRNWKLYVPIVVGGAVGFAFVWRVLSSAATAGFGMKDLTWYQYFFTECRVIWTYLLMFVLPIGQNVDADVPISHGVLDHGAIFGMLALLAVTVAAWIYRRKFPIASYGWFVFLILMAPTSSFVPIRDPLAERRLYLPFIGLLFIVVEFLRRWKAGRTAMIAALSAILLAESAASYQRNILWGSAIDLWRDSVAKSPGKVRPRFQLAHAYYDVQHCGEAVEEYDKAAQLEKPTYDLLLDWALAEDCAGKTSEAIARLRQAAALEATAHVYSQIAMEYGKEGKNAEALDALDTARKLDANFSMTYYYRGNIYAQEGKMDEAAAEYRHAVALDSHNDAAREALARMGR